MATVRNVGLVLIVILLVVYACTDDRPPPPLPGEKIVQLPPPGPPMTGATWGRIRFRIPTAWKDDPRLAADGRQIIFDGPRDKGEPTVSLFWVESKRTLAQWAEFMRKKYDTPGGPALVVDQGWSSLGRSRAYRMVYELAQGEISVGPKGGTHTTVDYYFQHDGHVGFLRCTCKKEYFAKYYPIFGMVADLYFLPPAK